MSNKLTDTQLVQEIRHVLEVEQFDSDAVRQVRALVSASPAAEQVRLLDDAMARMDAGEASAANEAVAAAEAALVAIWRVKLRLDGDACEGRHPATGERCGRVDLHKGFHRTVAGLEWLDGDELADDVYDPRD